MPRILFALLLTGLAFGISCSASARPAGHTGVRAHTASHHLLIGISEEESSMFSDPRFQWLKMKTARLVLPWDVLSRGREIDWQNIWLIEARLHGVTPLVAFEADPSRPTYLPSVATYRSAVEAFMKRYPWIHDYTPWNEENHFSQPTYRDPRRAAEYFNVVSAYCRSCLVTAADVLDEPNMAEWVEAFLRYAHHPTLWGLHNYADLSEGSSYHTRLLLSIVPGAVWFTETGGVVWRYEHPHGGRRGYFIDHGEAFAGRGASRLLALASVSSRITRIYYYQWRVPQSLAYAERHHGVPSWDSGVISPTCAVRPAFGALARAMGRNVREIPLAKLSRSGTCVPVS